MVLVGRKELSSICQGVCHLPALLRPSCVRGVAGCMGTGDHLSYQHSPRGVQGHPEGARTPEPVPG